MNKEAACKAASVTQRRIGWAVSSALAQVPASIPAGKPVGTCDPQVTDSRILAGAGLDAESGAENVD
jgi:hypothetical protein